MKYQFSMPMCVLPVLFAGPRTTLMFSAIPCTFEEEATIAGDSFANRAVTAFYALGPASPWQVTVCMGLDSVLDFTVLSALAQINPRC